MAGAPESREEVEEAGRRQSSLKVSLRSSLQGPKDEDRDDAIKWVKAQVKERRNEGIVPIFILRTLR